MGGFLNRMVGGSGASDHDQISGTGALYCLHGNGPVERGESAVIPNGQAQQISIRDLLVSDDHRGPKQGLVHQRHGVRPEMVVRSGTKTSQAAGHFGGSCIHCGIGRVTQNADAAVYGDRACCPSVRSIPAKPTVGVFVVVVGRIEESDQDIHIRAGRCSCSVSQPVYDPQIRFRGGGLRHEKPHPIAYL